MQQVQSFCPLLRFQRGEAGRIPSRMRETLNEAGSDRVYDELRSRLVLERTHEEVTFVFAGLAALLMLIAAILSLSWFGRAV